MNSEFVLFSALPIFGKITRERVLALPRDHENLRTEVQYVSIIEKSVK